MAESLGNILKSEFFKKGDKGKNPKNPQDINAVNNSGNNDVVTTNVMTPDNLNVADVAPSAKKGSKQLKMNLKTVFEGIKHKLDQRYELMSVAGTDEQRHAVKTQLYETHGMMSRFAREYEDKKLNFQPPANLPPDQTSGDEDLTNGNADDTEMSFGASGADDYKDVSGDVTIGSIIDRVVTAIKQDPSIKIADAFKDALSSTGTDEDDFEYRDDEAGQDDDYENDAQRSQGGDEFGDTNEPQQGQRGDGSMVRFNRL